jgi:hypothetical protein
MQVITSTFDRAGAIPVDQPAFDSEKNTALQVLLFVKVEKQQESGSHCRLVRALIMKSISTLCHLL